MKLTLIMSPAKGIYKQAVAPYKKGMQQVYMSSDLVIDGQTYKLVGIYPFSVLLRLAPIFDRFVIVDRDGNLVHDQDITWRCLRIFQLAVTLKNNMGFIKQCVSVNHRSLKDLITGFQELYSRMSDAGFLNSQNIHEECQRFQQLLQACIDSGLEISRLGTKILEIMEPLKRGEPIEEGRVRKLYDCTLDFVACSNKRALLVLETSELRGRVRELISGAKRAGLFSTKQKNAAATLLRVLDDFKNQEYIIVNTEDKNTNTETIESLKSKPYDIIAMHTDTNLQKHWLLREVHPAIPV
jgi:hypothetical protein